MNIYLENAGFPRNYKRLSRCCKQFGITDPVHFHLICHRGLSPLHLYLLTAGNKSLATLTLHIHIRRLTGTLVQLCNASSLLSCVVLVDRALTQRQWKRICKLGGIIRIRDTSTSHNEELYKTNRNVIWEKDGTGTIRLADLYHLTTAGKAVYQCHYSSCLGKTLYIGADGSVSFCPHHIEQSRIGTVEKLDGIFENPVFYEVLSGTVAKRRQCKQTCSHFEKCKGGCPFENDCEEFRKAYPAALQDQDAIISGNTDLSTLPLYKELAVLRHLCALDQPQSPGYQDPRS